MKIQVSVRDDRGYGGYADVYRADRWYLDDHQNLILKRGESDIAMISSDYWMRVKVIEEQKSEESS